MSTERLFKSETSVKNESPLHSCMMRISSHHRALYCYILLSVWIFLLVAGMYKYIGTDESSTWHTLDDSDGYPKHLDVDIKTRRIFKMCNPPSLIKAGSEGDLATNHSLEGIIIFLRHGDRGPMSHVRNISGVHCGSDLIYADSLNNKPLFNTYKAFAQNLTLPGNRDKFLGTFSDFPLYPSLTGECQIGQMTPVGLSQILRIGEVLRQVYGGRLGVGNGTLSSDNTRIYTTRYRRTFQSAVAFLVAFLTPEDLTKVSLQESYTVSFCFDDCACPAAEKYSHRFAAERSEHFKSHPAVVELVQSIAPLVYDFVSRPLSKDPHALRDALLAYVCHGAPLPCVDDVCVKMDQVTGLFAYTEWEARQYVKSTSLKRSCMLRAYGVLRNIVNHMLSIVSERKPRLVLYSGHDMTLQYVATALGLLSESTAIPHYASRLVIEVYRDPSLRLDRHPLARDFFFRVVFNGRDVTNKIQFCRGNNSFMVPVKSSNDVDSKKQGSRGFLCPIESIIRFLHDDYFSTFNATNFKDACSIHV